MEPCFSFNWYILIHPLSKSHLFLAFVASLLKRFVILLIVRIGEGEAYMLGGNHPGVLADPQNLSTAKQLPGNAIEYLVPQRTSSQVMYCPCFS